MWLIMWLGANYSCLFVLPSLTLITQLGSRHYSKHICRLLCYTNGSRPNVSITAVNNIQKNDERTRPCIESGDCVYHGEQECDYTFWTSPGLRACPGAGTCLCREHKEQNGLCWCASALRQNHAVRSPPPGISPRRCYLATRLASSPPSPAPGWH